MSSTEQQRKVYALIAQLDCWRLRLRDNMAGGPELVEELELFADAAEKLSDQARTLACKLDEDAEAEAQQGTEVRHAAE